MLGIDVDHATAPVAAAPDDPTSTAASPSSTQTPISSPSPLESGPIIWERSFTLDAPKPSATTTTATTADTHAAAFHTNEYIHLQAIQPRPRHAHSHLHSIVYSNSLDVSPLTVTSDTLPDASKPPLPLADHSFGSGTPTLSPIDSTLSAHAHVMDLDGGAKATPSSSGPGGQAKLRSKLDTQNKVSAKDVDTIAKWRKWAIEQSVMAKDMISARPTNMTPMVPVGVSPPASLAGSRSHHYYPGSSSRRQSRVAQDDKSTCSRSSRLDLDPVEVCNTDTARALRDVELAVDERALDSRSLASRRASANPRVSIPENPFIELGSRLASRRVRPIVVELIQALGHYVDAIWAVRYPGRPCPWVVQDRRQSLLAQRRPSGAHTDPTHTDVWKSRMLTAVQEGKRGGHIPFTLEKKDVDFWRQEVGYSLREVDEVVGIYKGTVYAFAKALDAGRYDEVEDDNVVGADGEGGNIARLLNDLEEALWGDAPPRATDLAYEVPDDFDPYADVTEPVDGGQLGAFFTRSRAGSCDILGPGSSMGVPLGEELYSSLVLPDLNTAMASETTVAPGAAAAATSILPPLQPDPLGLTAYKVSGGELSLEEIGRLRHQEWLQSRARAA